jgi:hypothetical protein
LAAVGVLSVTAPSAVDQPVTTEEDQTAGEDARDGPAVPGGFLGRLLDQVEGNRADEHPGTKAHDQPDHPQADAEPERDQGTVTSEDAARFPNRRLLPSLPPLLRTYG